MQARLSVVNVISNDYSSIANLASRRGVATRSEGCCIPVRGASNCKIRVSWSNTPPSLRPPIHLKISSLSSKIHPSMSEAGNYPFQPAATKSTMTRFLLLGPIHHDLPHARSSAPINHIYGAHTCVVPSGGRAEVI